jgi:hypothetical protein
MNVEMGTAIQGGFVQLGDPARNAMTRRGRFHGGIDLTGRPGWTCAPAQGQIKKANPPDPRQG